MSSILNWEPTSTAGEFESMGGTYRIVPDAEGFTLISNKGKTLDGKTWAKRFKSLAAAKAFPRIWESRQEVFGYQVARAIQGASRALRGQLRREFPTEVQLVSLIVEGYIADDTPLTGNRKLNDLARKLAVKHRI
jgi:hypothetical protein